MSRPACAIVVDPNDLFREGLRRILSDAGFRVVSAASILEDSLRHHLDQVPPQLLLLNAADHYVTVAEVRHFKQKYRDTPVVVLSDQFNLDLIIGTLQAGATGLVLKRIDHKTFVKSLHLVMLGHSVFSSPVLNLLCKPLERQIERSAISEVGDYDRGMKVVELAFVSQKFSKRELEILYCLTRGEENKVIARKCEITEATVKVHLKGILRKIPATNRTQAAIWAHQYLPEPGARSIDGVAMNNTRLNA